MDYEYAHAVAVLRRTPTTLTALLGGLPDAWTTGAEGPETWSAFDIVGHLLHGDEGHGDDASWVERIRVILDGGQRSFPSFNRRAMFDQYQDYSLDQLLAAFEQARAQSLAALNEMDITPEKLALTGAHPSLGTVTLGQLLATWVVHDLNHIGQIVEVMAHQYSEEVGPWRANLNILTRPILTE